MPALLKVARKPILIVVFLVAFMFMYHIASIPKVSNKMQSVAYYTGYDERACLPQEFLQKNPPSKKAKAAMVILVRNKEREAIAETLVNFEDKFNKNFDYPYVFLNEEPFTEEFKTAMKAAAPKATMKFGLVPKSQWSYPPWIDQSLAQESRRKMDESGKYNKQYGFVVTLLELRETIPSLWKYVEDYAKSRRIDISSESSQLLFPYFRDKRTGDFNLCHFWSNFEIASLNLWRSPQYRDFFNYLDQTGNFFYERWGDAPVHSLAAGLFLTTDQIHYFEDIGYQHDLYRHCPSKASNLSCRCDCPVGTNDKSIDHDKHYDTCLPQWLKHVKNVEKKKVSWWL
ncbi:nucleotide-diphospho-sugar transferase [Mucor mucedo]|uniref:nucleotide-diphospho-sugar transferase n=1 Tax=Mucor mucedo TaxID=29922 RepID=UPI00221E71C6|nr:nucleotide-diphospho-sugar transferase [Mucor mucedo]KAI7888483.1 nucleotide-diphospho-sugar transferase [Mucor mucedo]